MSNEHQLPIPPPAPKMTKEYKGYNGTMVLTDDCVIIKREGVKPSKMGGFHRGDKTIPYSSIVAVTHRKADRAGGYLKLTLLGGSEEKGGRLQGLWDENSIFFKRKDDSKFLQAKTLIEERITQSSITPGREDNTVPPLQQDGYIEELEKLAALRDNGIITEDDFNAKKSKLLGL